MIIFHPVTQGLISPQILFAWAHRTAAFTFCYFNPPSSQPYSFPVPLGTPSRKIDESIFLNDTSCVRGWTADETSHKIELMHISDKLLTWPIGTRLVCVGGFTKRENLRTALLAHNTYHYLSIVPKWLDKILWEEIRTKRQLGAGVGRMTGNTDPWGRYGQIGNNIFDVLWIGTNGTLRSDCAWVGNIVRCNRICSIDMNREREQLFIEMLFVELAIVELQGSRIEWMDIQTNRHVSDEEMKTIEMIPSTDHMHCLESSLFLLLINLVARKIYRIRFSIIHGIQI